MDKNIVQRAPSAESSAQPIIDGSDQSFMADVIEASKEQPVLVDFWAPWCGPCKQLTPLLEKAVQAAQGAVRLVKINMDDNPVVAGQLQVRSIPAVFAFYQGQPVDGFMGALPESQIVAFIDKLRALAGGDDKQTALPANIESAFAQIKTEIAEARKTDFKDDDVPSQWLTPLFEIVSALPEHQESIALLGHLLLDSGNISESEHLLAEYGKDDALFPHLKTRILTVRAVLSENLTGDEPPSAHSPQAQYEAARALYAKGKLHGAADILLHLVATAREFQEDAARKYLLKMMDGLEKDDGRVALWRRRLSAILFA